MPRPFLLPLFTEVRGRSQPVENSLYVRFDPDRRSNTPVFGTSRACFGRNRVDADIFNTLGNSLESVSGSCIDPPPEARWPLRAWQAARLLGRGA